MEIDLSARIEGLTGQLGLVKAEGSANTTELQGVTSEIKEQTQELEDHVASIQKMKSDIEQEHKETDRL